jgi:hypothetical protein
VIDLKVESQTADDSMPVDSEFVSNEIDEGVLQSEKYEE